MKQGLFRLALCLLAASCSREEPNAFTTDADWPTPPSVMESSRDLIVVTVDTLRADRLPFYGGERPLAGEASDPWSLAWMAQQGTLLEDAQAHVGVTLPSLASFWTGLEPLEHGALSNRSKVTGLTYVMKLRRQGWHGVGAVANGILRIGSGINRGFKEYLAFPDTEEAALTDYLLEQAASKLDDQEPLLLWAHYMAPHQPYAPPAKHLGRYSTSDGPPGTNETLFALHQDPKQLTPHVESHLKGLYDEEILAVQEEVQRLLLGLEEQYQAAGRGSLLENAVVIFASDHGEELGDRHGYFMHAKSLYAGVTQVPVLVLGQDWPAQRLPWPIGLKEVLPWVIEGITPDDGQVVSALKDKYYVLRNRDWTLVHNPRADGSSPGGPPPGSQYPYPTVALFSRGQDRLELEDRSAEFPEVTKKMLEALQQWHFALPLPSEENLSGVDRALLDSLGYANQGDGQEQMPPPWSGEEWNPH